MFSFKLFYPFLYTHNNLWQAKTGQSLGLYTRDLRNSSTNLIPKVFSMGCTEGVKGTHKQI